MTQHLKKPLYGNCLILAPDDKPLCRTNQKKLNWYLNKNLAVVVEGMDCPTIRLKFEPSGRKGADHPYLIAKKENRCVCCASEDQITRHHVVPYGFRKFFPKELKEHMLHDVLPLCVECHEKYETIAFEFKKELAKLHDTSLLGKGCYTDKSLYSVRNAGNSLYYHFDKMPVARREFLLDKLRDYYNKEEISKDDMLNAAKINPEVQTEQYVPFGKFIVDQYVDDMLSFIVMWRQHFVDHMKPKYLPDFWSVNYQLKE